jgi:hypothetical protein
MAESYYKWLHKNIINILIPALQDMGFEWRKQGTVKDVGREFVLNLPFGTMRRMRGDLSDLVQISLRKRDSARFVIRAGVCPKEGASGYLTGKHYALDDLKVDYLEESWVMRPYKKFYSDFGFRFKSLRNLTETDYERLVRRITSYLPEIDNALVSGKAGPHMHFRYIKPQYK